MAFFDIPSEIRIPHEIERLHETIENILRHEGQVSALARYESSLAIVEDPIRYGADILAYFSDIVGGYGPS